MKRAQSLLSIIFIAITCVTSIESYYGIIGIAPECREKLAGYSTAQQDTLMVVYDYDVVSIYKQYPDMYECLSRVQSSYKPGRSLSAMIPILLLQCLQHNLLNYSNQNMEYWDFLTEYFHLHAIYFLSSLLDSV